MARDKAGRTATHHDPHAVPWLLTDYDLHLLGEGKHWQSYERLGAQVRTANQMTGVNFAVWAPNATTVSVVGGFNNWDDRKHRMGNRGGIWELFIPGLDARVFGFGGGFGRCGSLCTTAVLGESGAGVEREHGGKAENPP